MPEVRAYFLFLSTGSVRLSRQQCSHKGLLHFWFSSFWTRKCNNSNNITMLENQQRCIVSRSTEHTKLRLELAISGFLKWVNHWKDILRLESAAPSHECHYKYLPHIESLLRSQTSSGWYISGRHTYTGGGSWVLQLCIYGDFFDECLHFIRLFVLWNIQIIRKMRKEMCLKLYIPSHNTEQLN